MNLPVPLILAGAILGSAIVSAVANIYTTEKTTRNNDKVLDYTDSFYRGANSENERYFQDYLRKHHLTDRAIRYPYRTGYNYNLSGMLGAEMGMENNRYARYNSHAQGFARMTGAGASAKIYGNSYRSKTPVPYNMYG